MWNDGTWNIPLTIGVFSNPWQIVGSRLSNLLGGKRCKQISFDEAKDAILISWTFFCFLSNAHPIYTKVGRRFWSVCNKIPSVDRFIGFGAIESMKILFCFTSKYWWCTDIFKHSVSCLGFGFQRLRVLRLLQKLELRFRYLLNSLKKTERNLRAFI